MPLPEARVRRALSCAAAALLLAPAGASAMFPDTPGAAPERPADVFPIDGAHDLGRNPANRFGGGRGHHGQDMFASCGTPVIAAHGGKVVFVASEGAAGNYIVLHDTESGEDSVYMHLERLPRAHVGDRIQTGRRLGSVGRSGDADGCHLHFELWTAPGWYNGGHAYDPLPKLRRWEAAPGG
jgi:murein DD-endopeptidase MepM/ murein hydrolase activator NlpD